MRRDRSAAKFVALLGCFALMHAAVAQSAPAILNPIVPAVDRAREPDPRVATDTDAQVASALQTTTGVDRAARAAARENVRAAGSRDDSLPSPAPATLAARIDQRDPKCDIAAIAVATAVVVACSTSDRCGPGGRLHPTTGCKLGRLTH